METLIGSWAASEHFIYLRLVVSLVSMTASAEFDILWHTSWPGLSSAEIEVDFSPLYRRSGFEDAVERKIWEQWEMKKKVHGEKLFNASKFRLHSVSSTSPASPQDSEIPALRLGLGLTDYREYICTNGQSDICKSVAKEGEFWIREKNDPNEFLARPVLSMALGCEALLITKDSQALLLQRSQNCATHAGQHQFAGSGHPEPSKVQETIGTSGYELGVREELFASVLCEICDEVGVERATLSSPRLLGIVADRSVGGKPDLIFSVDCALTASEVLEFYRRMVHAEAYESVSLTAVPIADFDAAVQDVRLTPLSVGVRELWKMSLAQ